jgi:hypothetical protein
MLFEEHRLMVFESWVLGNVFGPKRDEVTRAGGNCIMRASKFVIKYYLGDKEQKVGTACNTFGAGGGMYTRFLFGNLKERDYLENKGVNEWVLKCAFKK